MESGVGAGGLEKQWASLGPQTFQSVSKLGHWSREPRGRQASAILKWGVENSNTIIPQTQRGGNKVQLIYYY